MLRLDLRKISFLNFCMILSIGAFALIERSSEAVVATNGQYLNTDHTPSAVCQIKFENVNGSDPLKAKAECTGTLIRPNRILTAAHCIPNFTNYRAMILCDQGKEMLGINTYVANPAYHLGTVDDHDVAIIDLDKRAKKSTPIALAQSEAQIQSALAGPSPCVLYGYGRDDESQDDQSWGTLRAASFDYVPNQTFSTKFGLTASPNDLYSWPNHAAPGDSGGPTICTLADGSLLEIAVTVLEGHALGGTEKNVPYSTHEQTAYDIDWINKTADLVKLPN